MFSDVTVPYKILRPSILAYQECCGSETDVKTLLNPTIFTNYGLTYRDFYEVIHNNNNVIIFLTIK